VRDRHAAPARSRPRLIDAPKARMPRLLLLALVALGLAPGTFLRTPTGLRSDIAVVATVPVTNRTGISGDLTLTGAWELTSAHGWFGGFSALVAAGEGRLIAGSDHGWLLDLDLSCPAPRAVPGSFRFVGKGAGERKEVIDLESLARDPVTGTLWGGFERSNLVMRWRGDGARTIRRPPEIAKWSANSGPETLVRLSDGRFVMLAEGPRRGSETVHQALLFPRDPAAHVTPLAFRFAAPADYDPVDATQAPDGRVLILLRRVRYAIPAQFDTAIAIADPREIRAGQVWQARIIQRLSGVVFGDNFEGIAFVPAPEAPARGAVWLIADDNFSLSQRNLLVRFDWDGR
jgi:hypothetical protein